MAKKRKPSASTDRSNTLVSQLRPGESPAAQVARMMVDGVAMNAVTAVGFSKTLGELDLTECVAALTEGTRRVTGGDLAGSESLLTAQAVALNAMFTQLAHQASKMTLVDHIDRFTRLALKAQGQCRATVETLALMKNPPAVFAKQANIANGPQQVNNGVPAPALPARAGDQEIEPNKLLEAHDERLDAGTASAAVSGDSHLAPVGAVYRATKRGR